MFWINEPHLWIAFAATFLLIICHYLSPWFATHLPDSQSFVSFSGGVAVAYVFLNMLPNLVEYNKPIGKFLIAEQGLNAFNELLIYLFALFGFLIYYGLDCRAENDKTTGLPDDNAYRLHLAMFCLYNFLITYTMALRSVAGLTPTALFTIAMALHFVLTDRKFCYFYTKKFDHKGRFILILALFLGWLCTIIFDPVNVLIAAFMTAFLAGSVLLNVFREELPAKGRLRYFWFVFGALLIAAILIIHVLIKTA